MQINSYILAMETSCDETAIALLSTTRADDGSFSGDILSHKIQSQIEVHRAYGGVYPNMAKREHIKNILPILRETLETLEELDDFYGPTITLTDEQKEYVKTTLAHEEGFAPMIIEFIESTPKPMLSHIAVTVGPGLNPALWVGVNTAKVLGTIWNIPVVPVNHMIGHMLSVNSTGTTFTLATPELPQLALLVSGGHTEFIYTTADRRTKLGATVDDALGESFDKVARMLGLPYPGGPEIEKLATIYMNNNGEPKAELFPRSMTHTPDFNVSYSGLKTSVKYHLEKHPNADPGLIAYEFSEAAFDTVLNKLAKIFSAHEVNSLVVAGGVAASTRLRQKIQKFIDEFYPGLSVTFPEKLLATDNAVMIGIASLLNEPIEPNTLTAQGNLSI